MEENANNSDEDEVEKQKNTRGKPHTHWARHNEKVKTKQRRSELKTTDQILKNRKIQEQKKARQNKKLRHKKRPKK